MCIKQIKISFLAIFNYIRSMSLCKQYYCPILSLLLSFLILATTLTVGNGHNLAKQKPTNKSSITAVYIFGDSTVDPGNNNYIQTIFRSNFPLYGVDLPDEAPTGRFSNGRLPTDLIASYVGLKSLIPAYLDPNLSLNDFATGVSFASAGTGYDPLTAKRNKVIDMSTQLQYFDEYKKKLQRKVGKKRMEYIINNSAVIISCGTNDIVYTYVPDYMPQQPDKVATYLHFMLDQSHGFIQALIDRGVRKIGVVGLPPVGCLPVVMTLHTSLYQPRSCIESFSSIAKDFNQMLQHQLTTMQTSQQIATIAYGDIFEPLQDQFNNPNKYGFEVVDKGCCGTGLIEGSLSCNSLLLICEDRSKYLFWDTIHPTERSYHLLFEALRPIVDYILST